MLMVEVKVPTYVHQRIFMRVKKNYTDVTAEITRVKGKNNTRLIIDETPKGWWLALRILREGQGKLYHLKEIQYMEIPSKLMELSFKNRWDDSWEELIRKELKKWGLSHE